MGTRFVWLVTLPLLACGPRIIVDEGDETGTSSDLTGVTSLDPGTSVTSVGPLPSTVSSAVDSDPVDPTPGPLPDFDGPVPGDCWQAQSIFAAPDHVSLLPADQDGDGREELWVFWDSDGGGGPGETTVFGLDETGEPLTEFVFNGFAAGLSDIQGDGLLDVVAIAFEGGPPFWGYASANGFASFDLPLTPLELETGPGASGFFDVTGDGVTDVFRLVGDAELELLVGDGQGAFAPGGTTPLASVDFVSAAAVDGAGDVAVVMSFPGFNPGPECSSVQYWLVQVVGETPQVLAAGDDLANPALGLLRDTGVVDGNAVLYVDSCVPGSELHDLRQLTVSGGAPVLSEVPAANSKTWVAVGDFNGDGLTDLLYADDGAETMTFGAGVGALAFADGESTVLDAGDVPNNKVVALDMNGDGREELIRGVRTEDGNQLDYQRVYLGPCE